MRDGITAPVSGAATFCSIGLAFDGVFLYYDRCGDPDIYKINPITGALVDTFNTGIAERPNAIAFDAIRNGLWIGTQIKIENSVRYLFFCSGTVF
jgi:hypothetical protein